MSLNDVLLGKDDGGLESAKPKPDPYRAPAPGPGPEMRCSACGTPAPLEQTPVGPRCSRCALDHYRAVANIRSLEYSAPTGPSWGTRIVIRLVIGVVVALVMAAIRYGH